MTDWPCVVREGGYGAAGGFRLEACRNDGSYGMGNGTAASRFVTDWPYVIMASRCVNEEKSGGTMPRKIRVQKHEQGRKISRAEVVLYVVMAIIAFSMIFGTIFSALNR